MMELKLVNRPRHIENMLVNKFFKFLRIFESKGSFVIQIIVKFKAIELLSNSVKHIVDKLNITNRVWLKKIKVIGLTTISKSVK